MKIPYTEECDLCNFRIGKYCTYGNRTIKLNRDKLTYEKCKFKKVKYTFTQHRIQKKDRCEMCGSTKNLIVHHEPDIDYKNPKKWKGLLITLCGICHAKTQKGDKCRRLYERWLYREYKIIRR